MADIDRLKETITKGTPVEKKKISKNVDVSTIDLDQIDRIVDRMKKKYMDEGMEFESVGGKLGELRGIITEGGLGQVEIQRVEELRESKRPFAQILGKVFLKFRRILEPVQKKLAKVKKMEELSFYLYSANMRFSAKQYMAMTLGASFLAFIIGIGIAIIFATTASLPLVSRGIIATIIPFALGAFTFIIMLLIPKNKAKKRGEDISIELPFALRHMATELKAGIGLYRTIQAIAVAGYGPLSEEFARAVNEIEEGVDAKDALRHLALRTQSKALKNALLHVIRALETGGNLSEIMNEIAEDVSFELRLKVRDFSQKMNFFGVIFIFMAIVFPVMVTILGMIRNSPISSGATSFKNIPLTPEIISLIFLVIIPLMLVLLVFYIRTIQPKV
jgi:pilus assembly protein TadC